MNFRQDIGEQPAVAASTTVAGTKVAKNLSALSAIAVLLSYSGGTGGAYKICIQDSFDGGATWQDWYRTADITAGSGAVLASVSPKAMSGSVQTVGQGTTPALTTGTVREGPWGDQMRAVYEEGAGVSVMPTISIVVRGHKATG
jgi:hypothetical protein